MKDRFNPFKLADNLIEQNYRIPVFLPTTMARKGESFMTSPNRQDINLAEYLDFLRKYILGLQGDIKLYEKYHKAAEKIKNTSTRSEWQEGCRDTFGAGFFLERDEYQEFREIYWEIQKYKNKLT